jgi:hypothetical protein
MGKFFGATFYLLFAIFFGSQIADAKEKIKEKIWKFDTEVINSSIKCDLAKAARSGKYNIGQQLLKAKISVTLESKGKIDSKLSGLFPLLGIGAEAGASKEKSSSLKQTANFNINGKNFVNCEKKNKFATGLFDCFKGILVSLNDPDLDSQSVDCKETFSATYSGSASAKLPVWVITVGPSLSGSNTASYGISAFIPASRAPKEK